MPLTTNEELALMDLIEGMGPDRFSNLLFRATGVKSTVFVGAGANILTISVECVGWLRTNIHHAPSLLLEAARAYPAHPSSAVLSQVGARLITLQSAQKALGPPCEAVLAGGMPVVDRSLLRSYLAALIQGQNQPVIVVEGDSGLGRSHSWNLIRHVAANLPNVKPLWIDMVSPVLSQQTLPKLFDYLVRVLGLPPGESPTTAGVTGITLSERFLGEFVTRLQSMNTPWPQTPWLVFDHLDRNIAPEIKLFVMGLASLRLQSVFVGCVIFLLGPDPAMPLTDPAALAAREPLTAFLDHEIAEAAKRLNEVGRTPLSEDQLKAKLESLTGLRDGRSGRELAAAVCSELVALRQKVGAG